MTKKKKTKEEIKYEFEAVWYELVEKATRPDASRIMWRFLERYL